MIVSKRLAADLTGIRFLSGMCTGVYLKLFAAGEALLTNRAYVRLFTGVRTHMDHQLPRLDKSFGTDRTLVRAFAGVNAHVPVQLARMLEGSRAHFALVGPLLGVDAPMHTQILFHAEALVAKFTPEWFLACMGTIVTGETSRDGERFGTDIAPVRVGSFVFDVDLTLMRLERCLRREHFAARGTLFGDWRLLCLRRERGEG